LLASDPAYLASDQETQVSQLTLMLATGLLRWTLFFNILACRTDGSCNATLWCSRRLHVRQGATRRLRRTIRL